jgi:ribokinase
VTWITPNEPETQALLKSTVHTDDDAEIFAAADQLLASGAQNAVLKLGARGCVIAQAGRAKKHLPAFPVNALDTTAAGDAFNAAFAVGLVGGQAAEPSAVFASAAAAISVTRAGAQPSMPTDHEVKEFLQRHGSVAID